MARATDAGAPSLVIAAHGDRGGLRSNRLAHEIAGMVSVAGCFARVSIGFLRGTPALEDVSAGLPPAPVCVYPLFMSRGYYVNQAIPDRLGIGPDGCDRQGRPVGVMEPIGLRPVISRIIAKRAGATVRESGFAAPEAGILLAAHGSSKDPSSREATLSVAAGVEQAGGFRSVDCAFLEEAPLLDQALNGLAGPIVVVGMFIGEGMHGFDDLGEAVKGSSRRDIVLAPPLARWPEIAAAARDDVLSERVGAA